MLELPESQTISRQLGETVRGRKITSAIAGHTKHGFAFYNGPPESYGELLTGRVIEQAQATAGHVDIVLGAMRISFNDGTNIRYAPPGAKLPEKHQLLLSLDDGAHIYCTIQMYGAIMAFFDGEYDNFYYTVAKEKPGPLSDAFDEQYFMGIVSAAPKKLSAKGLLATEQRIPGLGNGCLQDILFNADVNPQSHVSALSEGELKALFQSVKNTLEDMAAKGGRNTEKDLFGKAGGYQSILSSKTYMNPCPKCGGQITRKAYMGGNVYFCPVCQPQKKA